MKLQRFFNYLFLLLLPSLIVSFAANSIILVTLSIISIFQIRSGYTNAILKKHFLFSAFFLAVLTGIFLDIGNDLAYESRHLVKRAAFMLMPFIICYSKKNYQQLSLKIFVYFLSFVSFVLLLAGLVRSVLNRNQVLYGIWDSKTTETFYRQDMIINWGELSYKRLFFNLDMHPSYYAFFSATAILILFFTTFIDLKKPLKWMLIALHALIIVLLSAKAGLASLFIIFIAAFFTNRSKKQKLASAVALLVLIIASLGFPATQLRLKRAYTAVTSAKTNLKLNSSTERITLWRTIADFDAGELITGVGIQSSRAKVRLMTGIDKNMHNQFLQALIDSGITGLILLLLFLVSPLFYNRSIFINVFITILVLNLLLENMLDRAWGIVFTSFFYGLFLFGQLNFSNEKSVKIEN